MGMWGRATMENHTEVPQWTRNRVAMCSSSASPGPLSGQNSWAFIWAKLIWKDTRTPRFTAALSPTAGTRDHPQTSINRGLDKEDVVHKYSRRALSYKKKKKKTLPFAATLVNLEIVILSEVSQTEKANLRYRLYVESKKGYRWTYLQSKQSYRCREQIHGYQG